MSWNSRRLLAVLLLAAAPLLAAEKVETSFVGNWLGALKAGPAELRLVVKIQAAPDGTLRGTADSPDQHAQDIPLSEITLVGGAASFKMPAASGAYVGKMSADGAQIDGEWTQGGKTFPLTLKRVDEVPKIARKAQEPTPPYPYVEEEVTYPNAAAGITLAGTLTKPPKGGPFAVVLLITGSGPQDRDARVVGHPLYLVLADQLTRAGIAVLRVDDRGVGRSTGSFATATTEDFAGDVLAGVEFLKTRKDIDPHRIGLYGHSEGGMIAPIVASRSKDVAFVVLAAAPGVPLEEGLPRQAELIDRANGTPEAVITRRVALQKKCLAVVKGEPDPALAEKKIRELIAEEKGIAEGGPADWMEKQIRMVLTPWFRYALTLDPRPALKQVHCPVLAINGEKDTQVPPENLAAVRAALEEGGNKNVRTVTLPGLNHLLQTCQTGSPAEYGSLAETLAPVAFETVSTWIQAQTKL
jgi:pimeloyl-ACP methyl ester carboxylesterase